MNVFFGILGLIILIVVSIDILWTTLLLAGGGPITNRVISMIWALFLYVYRKWDKQNLLSFGGLFIILVNLLVWISLIWFGWSLIFNSDPQAVLDSNSRIPADVFSRIYFTGYTLITLGIGDYVPGNGIWQILTVAASANGFIFITLSITYLLPIVSAIVQKRQLASLIYFLGGSPTEIIKKAWNGSDYRTLSDYFLTLTPQILELGQKQLAYPILHCFHTYHRETATAPNIAALDEALTILSLGTEKEHQPDKLSMDHLRHAISLFLSNHLDSHISDEEDIPPEPDIDSLRKAGITLVHPQIFKTRVASFSQRRRLLKSLVAYDGWNWEDVINPKVVDVEKLLADPTLHQ